MSDMNMYILLWLILMIVFVVAELITVGLTSIWFAAGSLCALIAAAFHANVVVQAILFFAVSIVLLLATRPWAKKYVNSKMIKTNSDSLIGTTIRISERVSNIDQTGTAIVNGQEWAVRTDDDNTVIEPNEFAKVVRIAGVKLIVEKNKED